MKKIIFKIYTLGCKANQYDSGDLKRKLTAAGFEPAEKNADVAIVNTCAVTKTAMRKDRQMVARARRENPKAKIILTGCWPKVYRKEAEKAGADLVWTGGKAEKFVDQIFNYQFSIFNKFKNLKSKVENFKVVSNRCNGLQNKKKKKSRYFIKIQDGCEQYCSYCIIPYARGKLKSRSAEEVVEEVKAAVEAGYREIILTGIHLGLYGREIKNLKSKIKNNLVELLKQLMKIKDLGRIRLSSIEVTEVNDDLIKLMALRQAQGRRAREGKICKHFHVPLQAGCDKILKRMNRPYDTKYFKEKIRKIRKLMPDVAITTDVIVGFPSETKKDFKETCGFIKKMRFSKLHVFPFSAHERTAAAKMDGKIGEKEIKRRAAGLRGLGERMESDYKKKFKGKKLEVVVERKIGERKFVGKTEYYFDIQCAAIQANQTRTGMDLTRKIIKVNFG